jgi:hypothetical protein
METTMTTDAFTAQIIQFFRHKMSDEAILTLVKSQLVGTKGFAAPLAPVAKAKPGRKPGPKPAAHAVHAAAPVKRGPGRPRKVVAEVHHAKPAKKGKPGKRGRSSAAGRQDTLNAVERIVKAGSGLAASDVAKAANIPQSRASTALKELKGQRKIFQGGDRRFARYAGDSKTAEQASLNARKHASGPMGRGGKKK